MRNVAGPHPQDDQRKAREAMKAVFAQKSRPRAGVLPRGDRGGAEDLEGGRKRALEAEEAALAYLAFPATHRTKIRTNNVQER